MASEKENFKSSSNEKIRAIDFSLQASATKPFDITRMMGKSSEDNQTDASDTPYEQEGN